MAPMVHLVVLRHGRSGAAAMQEPRIGAALVRLVGGGGQAKPDSGLTNGPDFPPAARLVARFCAVRFVRVAAGT